MMIHFKLLKVVGSNLDGLKMQLRLGISTVATAAHAINQS